MILDDIIKTKEKKLQKLKTTNYSLLKKLQNNSFTILAEIKKASPSKGIINNNFDPLKQIKKYEKGGADAVSILTEEDYFQGSCELLTSLRDRTSLPYLRKDFIIDPLQIYESKLIGADVILLIAAILNNKQINNFLNIADNLGLEVIVEVHDQEELKQVINTPARIIGINNRNLKDFTINLNNTSRLIDYLERKNLREKYYIISESGIKTENDVKFLKNTGIDGVLIGETLMKASHPSQIIKKFKTI
ncbi:MAG: indole-3-glycerol phosphate synthase TrpC [Bacillota bacterium]